MTSILAHPRRDRVPNVSTSARRFATEQRLVEQSAGGDRDAFGELVRRHIKAAHTAARSIVIESSDADDVCQDAFLAALVHIETLDPARSFRPWLLRIVKHRALDTLRRRRVRATEVLGDAETECDVATPEHEWPDARAERGEIREAIAAAVALLPPIQRSVFLLHDRDGVEHEQIGTLLGCATGTSRHHLFKARRLMRPQLDAYRFEGGQRSAEMRLFGQRR